MALIPGSYARAAGLQSEINKVTVTRVAGGEVQYRRAIDTYQRDLRYHVSNIGREQKQLRRSMRRYHRKLREGKKERHQRLAKVKEDSERLRLHAENFRAAEEAVKRSTVPLSDGGPADASQGGNLSEAGERNAGESAEVVRVTSPSPDIPDNGSGVTQRKSRLL